jgi:hypothetical protein
MESRECGDLMVRVSSLCSLVGVIFLLAFQCMQRPQPARVQRALQHMLRI